MYSKYFIMYHSFGVKVHEPEAAACDVESNRHGVGSSESERELCGCLRSREPLYGDDIGTLNRDPCTLLYRGYVKTIYWVYNVLGLHVPSRDHIGVSLTTDCQTIIFVGS